MHLQELEQQRRLVSSIINRLIQTESTIIVLNQAEVDPTPGTDSASLPSLGLEISIEASNHQHQRIKEINEIALNATTKVNKMA